MQRRKWKALAFGEASGSCSALHLGKVAQIEAAASENVSSTKKLVRLRKDSKEQDEASCACGTRPGRDTAFCNLSQSFLDKRAQRSIEQPGDPSVSLPGQPSSTTRKRAVCEVEGSFDASKCLARIWNGGKGGQCSRRPQGGTDFCKLHSKGVGAQHGRVDDGLTLDKLPRFRHYLQLESQPMPRPLLDEALRQRCCPLESSLRVCDFCVTAHCAPEAATIFRRSGFVILQNVIRPEKASQMLEVCRKIEARILVIDSERVGNRGEGRYSLGLADESGHLLHELGFARHLVDCKVVLDMLGQIFGEDDEHLQPYRCAGGGGDFVLSGVYSFQRLHSDIRSAPTRFQQSEVPPLVVVNYCLEDLTHLNGATRVIPGSQFWHDRRPPEVQREDEEWLRSKLFPLRAGSAIVRDARAWHGGTPNLSASTRFLPNAEFHSMAFTEYLQTLPPRQSRRWRKKCMPLSVFDELSPRCQRLSADLVASPRDDVTFGLLGDFRFPQNGSDGSGGDGFLRNPDES